MYKQKAPVREFVDDYVRNRISTLPYEDAVNACAQITELGKVLAETEIMIDIPAVDVLEIAAGVYPLQRFIYHFFMKCFWILIYPFRNAVINYDRYHPQLCSRHTVEEVRQWFQEEGLMIRHECVDHYGITIRGCR